MALGARFDDRVTGKLDEFGVNATIAHADIDPTAISKNVHVDIPVVGDLKDVMTKLNAAVRKRKVDWKKKNKPWLAQIDEWHSANALAYVKKKDVIKPQFVLETINEVTKATLSIRQRLGKTRCGQPSF